MATEAHGGVQAQLLCYKDKIQCLGKKLTKVVTFLWHLVSGIGGGALIPLLSSKQKHQASMLLLKPSKVNRFSHVAVKALYTYQTSLIIRLYWDHNLRIRTSKKHQKWLTGRCTGECQTLILSVITIDSLPLPAILGRIRP